tara:strand:+ start:4688 stop:6793 length:2106 start_codon:yes stop_codon:yes gene_type:complete
MAPPTTPPDLTTVLDQQKDYLANQLLIEEGLGKQYSDTEKIAAQEKTALELKKELYRVQSQGQQATLAAAEKIKTILDEQEGLSDKERQYLETKQQLLRDYAADSASFATDRKETLEEEIKLGNEKEKQRQKELDDLKKMPGLVEGAAKKWAAVFGIAKKSSDTMIGSLGLMVTNSGETAKNMKKMWESGMLGGAYLGILENVLMGQEKLYANFIKTTGANASLAEATVDASDSLRMMGLGMEEAFAASVNLMDSLTLFRTGTQEAQKDLILFTAELQMAGIQGNQAAKTMEFFSKTLGKGRAETKAATTQLIQFGRSLNMNVNQFLGDFNQLMPQLAAHGEKAEEVFKDLAIVAQQTGISLNNLMSIAAKYDTFEDSAKSVSRLNAVLGGPYLNSVEMVYATEAERLEMLHKTQAMSGKSFESMSRFEKKAFASAAGFRDVGEAANFFNTSLEVQRAEQEAAAEKQKTMNDLAREATPIMEELRLTMMQVAISLRPVIEWLSAGVKNLSKFLALAGGAPARFLAMTYAIYKVAKAFKLMGFQSAAAAAAGAAASPWTIGARLAAAGAIMTALSYVGGSIGGGGGGGEEESPNQSFAIGNPGNRPLRGGGFGVSTATVHKGEVIETGAMALPKYGTSIHTAQNSSNLAQSTQQMAKVVGELPAALATIMKPVDKQIMLSDKVLAEFIGDQVNEQLSILDRA